MKKGAVLAIFHHNVFLSNFPKNKSGGCNNWSLLMDLPLGPILRHSKHFLIQKVILIEIYYNRIY